MISMLVNTKRHNSVRHVHGVTVLVLCTSRLMILYICTKFGENILNGFKVIDRTQCPYQ